MCQKNIVDPSVCGTRPVCLFVCGAEHVPSLLGGWPNLKKHRPSLWSQNSCSLFESMRLVVGGELVNQNIGNSTFAILPGGFASRAHYIVMWRSSCRTTRRGWIMRSCQCSSLSLVLVILKCVSVLYISSYMRSCDSKYRRKNGANIKTICHSIVRPRSAYGLVWAGWVSVCSYTGAGAFFEGVKHGSGCAL